MYTDNHLRWSVFQKEKYLSVGAPKDKHNQCLFTKIRALFEGRLIVTIHPASWGAVTFLAGVPMHVHIPHSSTIMPFETGSC